MANTIPPLITTEGLVLNNQMPAQGALGNYTPPGTASSEGISLLMRGMLRAAIATNDPTKKAFCKFLFDSACTIFFKGERPSADSGALWNHSWIANGGAAFSVRGPLQPSGDLALSGYLYGRDPESAVVFTDGVGQLSPPPDIVYQVVSQNAAFVWGNVFSELVQGQNYEVDYYIDAKGNKIFGTQKGGSFGQPAIPVGEHNDGAPGKIVLVNSLSGTLGVNYCETVPDVVVGYSELYEAWPMWRRLAEQEVSTAADAIHWFLDAFALGKEMEPTNPDWINAFNRMKDVWDITCNQVSNNTRIFQAGANGEYNNFPLTYSYGYGRNNVDDPSTNWDVQPPSDRYTVARTQDNYVTFTMPKEDGASGSGLPIRYGVAFENKPLYLDYVAESKLVLDSFASAAQTIDVSFTDNAGNEYSTTALLGSTSDPLNIGMGQFLQFQQVPGDASGTQTGDWGAEGEFVMPSYDPVPFPGRRMATVGDSITFYNAAYVPPKGDGTRYENYGSGFAGYWVNAEQIMRGRTMLEHGIQPNLTGNHRGTSFAVAGTKVANWWLAQDFPSSPNTPQVGPMYAALNNLSKYDCVVLMGGTNDLSGNDTAQRVLNRLKYAVTDLAKNGKWVYFCTIPPRTRWELRGYTYIQQTQILQALRDVNQGIRDWVTNERPPNVFLVDWWDKLVGPNGVDPAGLVSHPSDPNGRDSLGNYRTDSPGLVFAHDGLHPGPAMARHMGEVLADVMITSGVPARDNNLTLGPLTLGPNLLSNPTFGFTPLNPTTNPANYNQSDIGWAYGLGTQVMSGALHNGYQYGKMPNNWHFYRSTNAENIPIGVGTGGVYSNFMAYTYSDMISEFPSISQYMANSTWPDGAVTVTLITHDGTPAIQIDVNMPVTGNKNESFVLVHAFPRRQHGPWDNYGYNGPDASSPNPMVVPNTVYFPGDMILAESDIVLENMNETCHSLQQVVYFYQNNPGISFGSKLAAFGNHPFFYPPSDMDRIRLHTKDRQILLRSPAIKVPQPEVGEAMQYAELRYEIGFDASTIAPRARIIIKNPAVRRITGGTPL